MQSYRQALLAFVGCAASAGAAFTGASVEFNGSYYFVDPYVAGELLPAKAALASFNESSLGGGIFAPVTVVQSSGNASTLDGLFTHWSQLDDVFHPQFLSGGVYVSDSSPFASASSSEAKVLNTTASVHKLSNATLSLPSGPYFVNIYTGAAHRAFKLYDDYAGAFISSLLQSPDGSSFQTLSAQRPTAMSLTIGVPSRLYFTRTAAQPLAGVRVGIKDLFALNGVRRSNGNRAWYHLYEPSNVTSPVVQRLVDAGAVVVGYQQLAQFANGDHPASDAVDMHMPFNPRGDGYTVPLGSSSGAAASVAAYDWLDLALGSDTGGSVRNPAQIAGTFGNRPTTGLVTLDTVTPLAPTLDSPGLLARDPALWDAAQQVLYGSNYTSLAEAKHVEYPKTMYLMGWPMGRSAELDGMLNRFANATQEITGARVERLDLAALWEKTRPTEAGNLDLATYLNSTYATIVATEQSRLVRDHFFKDYAAKHDGRKPYINPSAGGRWLWADTLPASAYKDAITQQQTFSKWFREQVLTPSGNGSCSQSIVLYNSYSGVPDLRTKLTPTRLPIGLDPTSYSPFSGVPDFAFPLGEVKTMSNITGKPEALPVAADIMAAQGCDGLITKIGLELVKRGAVVVPKAGGTLEGDEMLFRRDMTLY